MRAPYVIAGRCTWKLSLGSEYATNWATPQFYLHLVTAYCILRHNGAQLGKAEHVPHMFAWMRQSEWRIASVGACRGPDPVGYM